MFDPFLNSNTSSAETGQLDLCLQLLCCHWIELDEIAVASAAATENTTAAAAAAAAISTYSASAVVLFILTYTATPPPARATYDQ